MWVTSAVMGTHSLAKEIRLNIFWLNILDKLAGDTYAQVKCFRSEGFVHVFWKRREDQGLVAFSFLRP